MKLRHISAEARDGPLLEADLSAALERGEIELLYQPQYAAADGRVVGVEALARWNHPEHGMIGADALFAIAGEAGRAGQFSDHIIREGLAAAGDWPAELRLSLNVTAADLVCSAFAQMIADATETSGFPPQRLTLEITEQTPVRDLERSATTLRRLTALGIRIALDDFGAGFSNFRYLKVLPLHYLKLDRSMVEGICEDPRDLAVLRGVLAMARALDLEVVAEGIETECQREIAIREGCASWQGFLGSAPVSAARFGRMVRGAVF